MKERIPTESEEQQALIKWARYARSGLPGLDLLFHIPNEGKRSAATGARMKAEGLMTGVPDLCLPVARGGYHGLFIELKRTKGGKLSLRQSCWVSLLSEQGYAVKVCKGWVEASETIKKYLQGETL